MRGKRNEIISFLLVVGSIPYLQFELFHYETIFGVFLLIFGKTKLKNLPHQDNPFIGGPLIPEPPERWLKKYYWCLRGLKTKDERYIIFKKPGGKGTLEQVNSNSPGQEIWKIPKEKLELIFSIKDNSYVLVDYQSLENK